MKFTPLDIPEVIVFEPNVFEDTRGSFFEAYHKEKYLAAGVKGEFVQHNQSSSKKNVVRGLHLQVHTPQAKLIRILSGEVFDVAVDVRVGSPTFGKWVGARLSDTNRKQIFIPPGFAHGFVSLSENVHLEYKCTAFYDKADEICIRWNDPEIAIPWPVENPILSDRDSTALPLKDMMSKLPLYKNK